MNARIGPSGIDAARLGRSGRKGQGTLASLMSGTLERQTTGNRRTATPAKR